MKNRDALVILSGGQDSTTCLFWAKEKFKVVRAVTFNYGQRHQAEIDAARMVAHLAGVKCHDVLTIPSTLLRSASPLTSNTPLEQYKDAAEMATTIGDRIEKTFVPMRNMLFLTIAMNLAVHYKIRDLVIGVCESDNANYPDCTERFIGLATGAFRISLAEPSVNIHTPLIGCTKADTVKMALSMPGCYNALAFSHTSYDGKYPPTDMNHANVLRAAGFEEANIPDPLVERAWKEGFMDLPKTHNYDGLRGL